MTRPVILACLVALAATYGCAASSRETALKASLVTVDAARDGFLAYDRQHELALVAESVSAPDAQAKLAAYQAKRAKIDPLFVAAYHALAAAELLNTDQSLASLQGAVANLIDAVKAFTGGSK